MFLHFGLLNVFGNWVGRYMRRKCKICKEPAKYITSFGWGNCGNPDCGLELHHMTKEKEAQIHNKKFRRETRERKEALMTVSDWTKKVQVKFNAYIRERDKGLPCISCSRMDHEIAELGRPGGNWDAGHYRSRGASPELRFEPLNCHRQCKSCNGGAGQYSGKDHTVQKAYRKNLINRIGIEKVEWLEGAHPHKRYRIPELQELYKYWSEMLKEEKNKNEDSQ